MQYVKNTIDANRGVANWQPLEEEEGDRDDRSESPLTETINLQKMRLNARKHFHIAASEKHVKPPTSSQNTTMEVNNKSSHQHFIQPIVVNSDRDIMKINSIFRGNKTIGQSLTERGSHFEFSR